jgi:hypothetical protein
MTLVQGTHSDAEHGGSAPTTFVKNHRPAWTRPKYIPLFISGGVFNLANDLYTSTTGGCNNLTGSGSR